MAQRPYTQRQIRGGRPARRPFWLPASNYYVLAIALSAAFFFLMWGILHDAGEETPWITAGVSASMLLVGAVVLREVILRRARARQYRLQRQIDATFAGVGGQLPRSKPARPKLTLEQNAAILDRIKQKSHAAKVLDRFSAGHREVFELCHEYLVRNDEELRTVAAGSPRFSALLKGRNSAAATHRFHLLQWAEIEARQLINEANVRSAASERIEAANKAATVIDYALESYPADEDLLASRHVVSEMIVTIKASDAVERAERAVHRHDYREAISNYRDALFYLGRDNLMSDERQRAADRLNAEIERLRSLDQGN